MNAVSQNVFQFDQSANVRTFADEKGEYWFLANDVCAILGYTNPRKAIADHCRPKGVSKRDTLVECGVTNRDATSKARKSQEMTYINEPNLYRLIIKSRKPEAEAFEEWVMEEVLPTIRKTGSYELHTGYLNEWERHQIQNAVKARCDRTGETRQAVYRKLHAFMNIPSYEQISATQFQTALNFLASMANAPEVFRQPEAPQLRNLKAALHHGLYCAEFIYRHSEALRGLNRRLAAGIHDHATAACACIRSVAEQVRQPLPDGQFFEYYPWDGDCEAKRRYLELCI